MLDQLVFCIVCGTSLWVLIDSRNIGIKKGTFGGVFNMGPTEWFFACLLCWIAAFPAYLVKRRKHIRAALTAVSAPGPVTAEPSHTDFISQLGALADRCSQGLLTDEEFQAQKKALVHRMLEQSSPDA